MTSKAQDGRQRIELLRGEIRLPRTILKAAGMQPGSYVRVRVEGDRVVLERIGLRVVSGDN